MDPGKYRDVKVQRGYTYQYYYTAASPGQPTLLFIHGFPSSSFDWSRQVAYFQPKGYGLLVPDCLGYGGTSKPASYEEFRWKLLAQDLVDILDAEHLQQVVGIAHDWGSMVLSSLAQYHQDRFAAFAWVGLSYIPPRPEPFDYQWTLRDMKEKFGSEVFGYWAFFAQPDAYAACERNLDSFLQLLYPELPETTLEWLCPIGKSQEWVESNRQPGRASWLSEQEYSVIRERLATNGLRSAMNYYKLIISDVNIDDDKALPKEDWYIRKPVFFAVVKRDYVCLVGPGKSRMQQYAPHAEIVEFDTGHSVQFEATEKLNDALETWVKKLTLASHSELRTGS